MKKRRLLSVLTLSALLPLSSAAEVWQDPETKVNYEYTPGGSEASVTAGTYSDAGSPDATGDIAILATFTVDGNTYSVTSIGNYAFYSCSGLTSVDIPSGVTNIGRDAFYGCSALASVNIPKGVTTIDEGAFHSCKALTSMVIPEGVTTIRGITFFGCSSLKSVSLPSSITCIEDHAFSSAGLTSIVIPNGVTSIGSAAFMNCDNLKSVSLPSTLTSIDSDVFHGTPWYSSYYNNAPLGLFYIGNILFGHKGYATGDIVIKNGTRIIAGNALYNCKEMTSVSIPSSVINIGASAFYGCSGLTSLTIPKGVTGIGRYAFIGCSGLTSISLPTSLVNIEESTFSNCSSLTSVTIPEGVASIGRYAFSGCSSMVSVTIPSSLSNIGNDAFSSCSSLEEVHIADIAAWCGIQFTTNNNPLGYAHHLYLDDKELKSLSIPEGTTSISNYAFNYCSSLTSVTIPEGVTAIGASAFEECTNLTSVNIPSSVSSIGGSAFNDCSLLTSVTSLIQEPFEINKYVFMYRYNVWGDTKFTSATLYVPKGTKEKYEATPAWNEFQTIIELDDEIVGVEKIARDGGTATVTERYALGGQRTNARQKGLNIERMSDGTVRKVVVR